MIGVSEIAREPGALVRVRAESQGALRVTVSSGSPLRERVGDGLADRAERAWEAARAANPALFDGPMLSVDRIDHTRGVIECRRASYRELVAQTALAEELGPWSLGVAQLSVTGLLVGRDAAGQRHVVIGRRSEQTRIYPRMWELAPSGGVELADAGGAGGGIEVLMRALDAEAREELGMELDLRGALAVALAADAEAGSLDVVVRVEIPGVTVPHRAPACGGCAWEYIDTAWLSERDAGAFVREHARAVIPPTRAALARLGELLA
jgi:hypothetical protein